MDQFISDYCAEDMADFLWHCILYLPMNILLIVVYGLHTIWYNRNLEAHGGKSLKIEDVAVNTLMRIQQFQSPDFKFQIIDNQNDFSWGADENYTIRINCDASWIPTSRKQVLVV